MESSDSEIEVEKKEPTNFFKPLVKELERDGTYIPSGRQLLKRTFSESEALSFSQQSQVASDDESVELIIGPKEPNYDKGLEPPKKRIVTDAARVNNGNALKCKCS